MADRRPLIHETSDLSDSAGSTPALPGLALSNSHYAPGIGHIAPPASPPASRPGFQRLQSDSTPVIHEEDEDAHVADSFRRQSGSGLGIGGQYGQGSPQMGSSRRVSIQAPPQRTVVSSSSAGAFNVKSPDALSPPGSANPFIDSFQAGSSTENTPDLRRERFSPRDPRDDVGTFEDFRRGILKNARQSTASVNDYQQYLHTSDTEQLRDAPSIKSAYENDFRPTYECPATRDFYQSRFTWLNISFIIICVFSCIFSGIFLGLAIREPFWGKRITSHGPLKPADAILLTTVFAKLIELSFVTSFVAFLGQVLSRRAFMKEDGRGVTLSELSMWRWVVQPGTLITHWESARYAGLSLLGILSLVSTILATLYSTAATALVQPALKEGSWKSTVLAGRVKTDFANIEYIKDLCQTPIRTDKQFGGNTCLQIEHAGQGYFNYQKYLAEWDKAASNGTGSSDQTKRPPGFGLLYENTTISAQWIDIINTTEVSKKLGRAINNVSLAFPHAGVFEAARNPRNGILQPEELNSEGTYSLRASVPSPVMNVMCVQMNKTELAPIVFDTWNNDVINITSWVGGKLADKATTTNKTVVDDIFGWNNKSRINYPPVFAKYPKEFNTLMNHTSYPWGRPWIYLLGRGGPADDGTNMSDWYSLCRIGMVISPGCATQFNARSGGNTFEALCEGRDQGLAYSKHNPDAPWVTNIANWKDIGFDWSNSLSLQTGIVDGDASNSRLLTQLMLKPTNLDPNNFQVELSPALPSMGEALAVMSGCTLLKSMTDAPFVTHDWNYTLPMLDVFQTQYFNASLKAQQYASGGADDLARAWIPVLALVFGLNMFVLAYFIFHRGLVTDYSEPPNLFALAVNSPPSHVLAGSCGGGPEGKQYMVNWFVKHEGSHLFMEPGEKSSLLPHDPHGAVHDYGTQEPKQGWASGVFGRISGVFARGKPPKKTSTATAVESLRPVSSRPVSVVGSEYELQEGYERTKMHYDRLAKRRSRL